MKRTPKPADPLAARVWAERYRKFWSIRDAAEGSGVTNQTWSAWEKAGGPVSDKMRSAVSSRFDWPADWPENPPELNSRDVDDDRVELLGSLLDQAMRNWTTQLAGLVERVEELERRQGEP